MQTIFLDISNVTKISMEPAASDGSVILYAKQGDVGRTFKAVLKDGDNDFLISAGAQFSVWFTGPSGVGNYSAIGDRSAFSVDGSTVTVELITQMLQNPGSGSLCLVLNSSDGAQLGLWNVVYAVEHVPGMGSEPAEDYYTAFTELARQAIDAAQTFETDKTLSNAGKAADAAAVGTALAGKAPAGFMSGRNEVSTIEELKDILLAVHSILGEWKQDCRIIVVTSSSMVLPSDYWVCETTRIGSAYSKVVMSNGGHRVSFSVNGNALSEFEWDGPPMALGVEYRTSERWQGKAVYAKLVNYGLMPAANGVGAVAHGAAATQIVRCLGQNITAGNSLPAVNDGNTIHVCADKDYVYIHSDTDASMYSAYVQIWYTKN